VAEESEKDKFTVKEICKINHGKVQFWENFICIAY
jgi:hypothetical protein